MSEHEQIIIICIVSFLLSIAYYMLEELLKTHYKQKEDRKDKDLTGGIWEEARKALRKLGYRDKDAKNLLKKVSYKIPNPGSLEEVLQEVFKMKNF